MGGTLSSYREEVLCPEYRARIFYPTVEADARELARLQVDPRTQIFDTLVEQLHDLIRARHPRERLACAQVNRLAADHLGGISPEYYGVWVYYPWSYRLVHLLDEPEFVELRTDRNKYKISPSEQHVLAAWRVGIVGLSVGQSVAITMALERGCGEIRLADFDSLDLSNLNRLRTGIHNLGLPKVYITAREIAEIDPFLQVLCFPKGVTDETIDAFLLEGGKLNLIIDECDSLDIKILLRLESQRHRIPVVMDTSDRGLIDVERFDVEPERPLFHGLIEGVHPERLRGLTTDEKLPHVLKIIGEETISTRLRGSLLEVGQSISTWPQLASGVALGGAAAVDVSRRIALRQGIESGRYFVDLEELIGGRSEQHTSGVEPLRLQHRPGFERSRLLEISQHCVEAPWCARDAIALDRHQLRGILESAVAAPSGGNAQPWIWVHHKSLLLLYLDRSRCSPLLDFQGIGGILALGAAAENVVLAAHHQRLEVCLHALPHPEHPDLVAAFEFLNGPTPAAEPHIRDSLYDVIQVRHTNRRNGRRRALPSEHIEAVVGATRSVPGADIQMLTSPDALDELGQLIGAGDRLRLFDKDLHAELMAEIRWTKGEAERRKDGIDIESLELSPLDRAGLEICRYWNSLDLVRQWRQGAGLEKISRKAIDASSAVALITMPRTRLIDYFHGGRAVQRAWLTANRNQIALHPMTALPYLFARLIRGNGEGFTPDMIRSLRELRARYCQLFHVTDEMGEVMLCRLSIADGPSCRSLRRPIDDVLIIRE